MTDAEALTAAVTAAFVRDGRDLTVPEIAAELGWTESKVRRVLAKAHGCVPGLACSQEHRPSYSKSYRGMQSGTHRVWVYGPTRETLRKALQFAAAMRDVEKKSQTLETGVR